MQYYLISPDLYCYPQIKGFGDTIFISNPRHIFHFLDKYAGVRFTTSPPKWAPHLDYLVLNPRLRKKGPSDVLSEYLGITNGFIISNKFKTLLEGFTLSPHVYYPCRVGLDGVFWDYYYLFFYGHLGQNIDFGKSPVLITEWYKKDIIERIVFKSFDEYKMFYLKKSVKYYYEFEQIMFKQDSDILSMMSMNLGIDPGIVVEEVLVNAIVSNKISNAKFEKIDQGYIEYL